MLGMLLDVFCDSPLCLGFCRFFKLWHIGLGREAAMPEGAGLTEGRGHPPSLFPLPGRGSLFRCSGHGWTWNVQPLVGLPASQALRGVQPPYDPAVAQPLPGQAG